VKSTVSHYGQSVRFYRREGDRFKDLGNDERYTAEGLYHEFERQAGRYGLIIQERVRNHPRLVELSQSEALQTIRVITYYDRSNDLRILHALFRPVATDELVDNYNNFDGGILMARVDLATGTIRRVHFMRDDIPGTSIVDRHPVTKVPFAGYQLPDWESAMACVRDAAQKMLPIRLAGWDLAITPMGPVIIEGNSAFNTNYLYGDAKEILFNDMAAFGHAPPHTLNAPSWLTQ